MTPRKNGRHGPREVSSGPVVSADVLPANVAMEEQLAAMLLMDDGPMFRRALAAGVTSAAFTAALTGAVWKTVAGLRALGQGVDLLTVVSALHAAGELERLGGPAEVARLSSVAFSATNLQPVLEVVVNLAERRALMRSAAALFERAKDGDAEGIGEQREKLARLAMPGAGRQLPPLLDWPGFMEKKLPMPQELVEGLFHRGSKFMLGGGSKSFKTWCLLDMALSVATGSPWWGMKTQQAPVLYVNFELMREFCQERVTVVQGAKKIGSAPDFYSWHLRGYARDLSDLVPHMIARAAGIPFGLIVLDPIYKCLGDRDENSNGEVAGLLNEVEALAVRTNAAIAFGHHFAKGLASNKESKDRVSGAGAWARDPDALMTMTAHDQEDCYSVECTLRNCKPKPAFVVRWKHPLMERQAGMDPSELKGSEPGRPKEHHADKLLELLRDDLLTFKEFQLRAVDHGMSASTFKRLLGEILESGQVAKEGTVYRGVRPF